ncbi:MAG: MlaD family protein [Desulfobacteraceae bacterium]
MSREANTTIIGAFIAGAVVLAAAGIIIFGSGNFFSEKNRYVLFFDGSVQGLSVGSPVVFRGVKIGSVKSIHIKTNAKDMTFSIPVLIEIEDKKFVVQENSDTSLSLKKQLDILIDKGLRAQLEMQSMVTGMLLINLDFHPQKAAVLKGKTLNYPEIPTIQSEIDLLTQKIKTVPMEEIFNKLLSIATTIENAFKAQKTTELVHLFKQTLVHVDSLIVHLDEQVQPAASEFEQTMKDIQKVSKTADTEITRLGSRMDTTLADIQTLAQCTRRHMEIVMPEMETAVKDIQGLTRLFRDQISPLSAAFQETARAAEAAAKQTEDTLSRMARSAGKDSELVVSLTRTLDELSRAARSFRLLTEYLERHPEALIRGKQPAR